VFEFDRAISGGGTASLSRSSRAITHRGLTFDLRARALLDILQRYSDPDQVRWIHLMDGGISDNLALRVLLSDALLMGF